MKQSQCEALILHTRTIFEKDKLIECMSPTKGKFTCLAKSAAQPKSKTKGTLSALCIVSLNLYKGRSFQLVSQCDLVQHFPDLQTSFNHLQYALFFINILRQSVTQHQENRPLYELVCNTLRQCNAHVPINIISQSFFNHYLTIEGIHPQHRDQITLDEFLRHVKDYTGKLIPAPIQL